MTLWLSFNTKQAVVYFFVFLLNDSNQQQQKRNKLFFIIEFIRRQERTQKNLRSSKIVSNVTFFLFSCSSQSIAIEPHWWGERENNLLEIEIISLLLEYLTKKMRHKGIKKGKFLDVNVNWRPRCLEWWKNDEKRLLL